MLRLLLLKSVLLLSYLASAHTILVKNIEELNAANKKAMPGDIILLQDGKWKDVVIKLNCKGTKENPITVKAQTAGKVLITGKSMLKLGGSYIIVDGFFFTNGYAGSDAVISYRIDKNQLADNCRVTNSVILDFNNPKRMDDNNWVLFYGKNNRLDHCSFRDKKNMGVLLAVILDDERSRENFHEIDHNYFGRRTPLGSNGGEIIRVGVSQHCQYNSNTQITENFFEYCDGETEIVSIKSGSNMIQDNIFKESQGSLVLRHGDNNTVSGNLFFGNDKTATGGVRVINKGQVVRNNVFYKCRGAAFKAPIAVMNGIPNSPAHRYVQVTDAEITDNIFYECSPLSFGEGSDAERTLPPDRVTFTDNSFYNTRDSVIYTTSDAITGFNFEDNRVSSTVRQALVTGFTKTKLTPKNLVQEPARQPLFADISMIPLVLKEANSNTGAAWFSKKETATTTRPVTVNCATAEELYKQLERKEPVIIRLTGKEYTVYKPFLINKTVQITGNPKIAVRFNTYQEFSVFAVAGDGNLSLSNLTIDGSHVKAGSFISNDSSGQSNHYNVSVRNCSFDGFAKENGCNAIFFTYKSLFADSIVFRNNNFTNNSSAVFVMNSERDDKGYYAAEKIIIHQNNFAGQKAVLLDLYRGGNDESTLGPNLVFTNNKIKNCSSDNRPLLSLTGVQQSLLASNSFTGCNSSGTLILYKDIVRARHIFEKNILEKSGAVDKNQFVTEKKNTIR